MSSLMLRRLRGDFGDHAVAEVLARSGAGYDPGYLDDPSNWIWYDEALALFEAAVAVTGDELFPMRIGEDAVRQHAGTQVATVLRGLGSPEAVYEQLTIGVTKFSTVTAIEPVEVVPGRAVVRATMREGFEHHVHMCAWRTGLLSSTPMLFGLPPAAIAHPECALRGDDHCLYEMTWDAEDAAAASDPQRIITALETQLAAMTDRLGSMYATARDLIALDDLDDALQRITERAAVAVRAPKYLLAVRAGDDGRLCVHHRGFDGDEAIVEAQALLEGGASAAEGQLVAEVASATRHYGYIMAASLAGAWFAHERDLLDVYARYAAAVLDSFGALDSARRREAQSSALLGLARALASGSSREDVARRLADAMPAIVDCDRVSVSVWHEDEGVLVCHAVGETSAGLGQEYLGYRVGPDEAPELARILADPRPDPLFYERDTEDPYLREILARGGTSLLIILPIVAHGRLHGILNVSVVDREERLRRTDGLLDLLGGIVAQTATALDNARLIEDMAHQARHDSLTGLLGHRAFHEAVGALARTGERFTLATIDIDDFKLINDVHGHPVGDQALARVSEALRRSVRDEDAVFRVGGEEFAVVFPGLGAVDSLPVAERLRAAVSETPFRLPLRVSVGLASCPDDAEDVQALLERADDALYAAKRSGKDRVRLAAVRDAAGGASAPALGARKGLLEALGGKDAETLAHCATVGALAVDTARAMGLDDERVELLRVAGQLHDVGKIVVPDAVLAKPGRLDDEEMAIVRTHSRAGAELARAWGFTAAAELVLQHHERFDGSGYPDGLAGEEIALEARILHAVDAYAAMTADRPYRAALAPDVALAELRDLAGVQFDPDVVAAIDIVLQATHAA